MLNFFPEPYPNELLYSTIARYHYYARNIDYKDTLSEVFGEETIIPSLEFPSHLEYLEKQLKHNKTFSSDYFIKKNSLFPLYAPFLPYKRNKQLKKSMKIGKGNGIYTKIGMVAGGICQKQGLYYCSKCVKDDVLKYGEGYFHREHQVQGIIICPKHGLNLEKYPIDHTNYSRIGFIRLDYKKITLKEDYMQNKILRNQLLELGKGVFYILNNDITSRFNQQSIYEKYKVLLHNKNLLTIGGNVKQRELYENFMNYYGEEFLNLLDSNIEFSNEYNWLKVLTRSIRRVVHPIRNILFINFLVKNIEDFFTQKVERKEPFGTDPWPCLNKAADHYKKNIIQKCTISSDYKTRLPVGTFKCSCGFIYSRKGPDKSYKDRYNIGRIKKFGGVWENRLEQLLNKQKYGVCKIAEMLDCDPKTIKKYITKIEKQYSQNHIQDTSREKKEVGKDSENYRKKYSETIKNFMEENPNYNRTQIRNELKKEYAWFYRNDKNWLYDNLPQEKEKRNNFNNRVDWGQRDREIKRNIQELYLSLILEEPPVRITKSLIGKKLNISSTLYYKIDKLPLTRSYLEEITETIEDFRIRRVDYICNRLYKQGEKLKKWKIERQAGLRKDYSQIVENRIYKNIEVYNSKGVSWYEN